MIENLDRDPFLRIEISAYYFENKDTLIVENEFE